MGERGIPSFSPPQSAKESPQLWADSAVRLLKKVAGYSLYLIFFNMFNKLEIADYTCKHLQFFLQNNYIDGASPCSASRKRGIVRVLKTLTSSPKL